MESPACNVRGFLYVIGMSKILGFDISKISNISSAFISDIKK